MQGNIDFTGSLSGSIAGGGSGGSDVTITPTLQSGTKIADFTIDSESGSLYAPQSGSLVTITPTYIDGEKIADFSIDGVAGKIYQPEIFYIHTIEKEYTEHEGDTLLFYYTESDGDRSAIYCPASQPPLTAGQNITIDSNNVISASGDNRISYSLTEQDTGITWLNGEHIYQKTYYIPDNINITNNGIDITSYINNISDIDILIDNLCMSITSKSTARIWVGWSGAILKAYCAEAASCDYLTLMYTKVV